MATNGSGRPDAGSDTGGVTARLLSSGRLLAGAFAGGAAVFLLLLWGGGLEITSLSSVVLIIAGFVTVALLLLTASAVMAALGMATPGAALGMPEGSIRALIAMVLILMFAIIGIVVFNSATSDTLFQSTGLTQAQVDQARAGGLIVLEQVRESMAPVASGAPTPEPLYAIQVRPAMTPESHDFGLQLITTVSTLVVAVAGFYFGSKATELAVGAGKDFRPPARPSPGVLGTQPESPAEASDDELVDEIDDELDADGPDEAAPDQPEATGTQPEPEPEPEPEPGEPAAADGDGPDGDDPTR